MQPPDRCPECGAPRTSPDACRAAFDELLAIEFERRPAFAAVHHLTVACYYLQHPAGHRPAVLDMWQDIVAKSLDGRATPAELLQQSGERFAGAERVRETGALPPAWWPHEWPMTVQDAAPPRGEPATMDGHITRVRDWAAATRATLDAQRP